MRFTLHSCRYLPSSRRSHNLWQTETCVAASCCDASSSSIAIVTFVLNPAIASYEESSAITHNYPLFVKKRHYHQLYVSIFQEIQASPRLIPITTKICNMRLKIECQGENGKCIPTRCVFRKEKPELLKNLHDKKNKRHEYDWLTAPFIFMSLYILVELGYAPPMRDGHHW